MRALAHALRYGEWREQPTGTVPVLADVDVNEARRRLPREVLRLHQILANGGSIQWAQQSAAAFAEAAAREFHSSAFASVPPSPDLEWLRGCVDFLVQRET